uniref:hypothetical protein n=1 Tax=Cupriavidus taiwanensis TaxID=164546 RepID=UPI0011C04889|nr:hypothetical protein [Cupriavidus taiwanensis]
MELVVVPSPFLGAYLEHRDFLSGTLGESSLLIARTYLSTSYLTTAAQLAQKAYAIETGPAVQAGRIGLVERDDHHACASAAIIMSALGVEAFVNELFADCQATDARNLFGLSDSHARKLAHVWGKGRPKGRRRRRTQQTHDFQFKRSLDKYAKVLTELDLPRLDFKAEPVKAMDTLISLRNALAHYKLAIQTVGGQSEQRALTAPEKELQQYFPDHDQPRRNPMTGVSNAYILDRVIGHAVAEWSVQTAVAFLEHFRELLSVTPHRGHRWPTQVMLLTR